MNPQAKDILEVTKLSFINYRTTEDDWTGFLSAFKLNGTHSRNSRKSWLRES
jgi:hypothetical protein